MKDINKIYNTTKITIIINSLKNHIDKFVTEYMSLTNTNNNDLTRLEEYKEIIRYIQVELDLDVLDYNVTFECCDSKWEQFNWMKTAEISMSFSSIFNRMIYTFSSLQNKYHKTLVEDVSSKVYQNFPKNLFSELNLMKMNGYENLDELLDIAFENILKVEIHGLNNGPNIIYETFGSKIFDNFIKEIINTFNPSYNLDKISKYYEKYMINNYWVLEQQTGNKDPNGIPYDAYAVILSKFLILEDYGWYNNLEYINTAFLSYIKIDYKKIIEYGNLLNKNKEIILSNILFYEKYIIKKIRKDTKDNESDEDYESVTNESDDEK